MVYINLTYKVVEHFMTGAASEVAGVEDKVTGPNGCFSNAQIGERVIFYSSEVRGVVGIGVVVREAFRDSTPVWRDGIYPNRLGVRVLAYNAKGIPLEEIRLYTGVDQLTFLYLANGRTDTANTNMVNEYLWTRFQFSTE